MLSYLLQKSNRLQISWKNMADLPTVISSPQIVKTRDFVFVGGGFRKDAKSDIFQYSIHNDIWRSLPDCPWKGALLSQQGLALWNGELISIGGKLTQEAINTVYTFKNGKWVKILPRMPTARYLLSTTSHHDCIVAAGGVTGIARDGQALYTQDVEIFIKDRQWYVTKMLPAPMAALSTCIVGETIYMLGGTGAIIDCRKTFYVSLQSLIDTALLFSSAARHYSKEWNVLTANLPLVCSTAVEIDRVVIAMGGSREEVLRCGTIYISTLNATSNLWAECEGSQLPVPLYRPGVVKLADNKVMVIGGQPKMQHFSNEVYIGTCRHWDQETYSHLYHRYY